MIKIVLEAEEKGPLLHSRWRVCQHCQQLTNEFVDLAKEVSRQNAENSAEFL